MTLRPGTTPRRGKGQPEGSAVKGKTGKPGAADPSLVQGNAAGHNNSNLTPLAASVANGGWELLLGIVPIVVLYTCHIRATSLPWGRSWQFRQSLSLEVEKNPTLIEIYPESREFLAPGGSRRGFPIK